MKVKGDDKNTTVFVEDVLLEDGNQQIQKNLDEQQKWLNKRHEAEKKRQETEKKRQDEKEMKVELKKKSGKG